MRTLLLFLISSYIFSPNYLTAQSAHQYVFQEPYLTPTDAAVLNDELVMIGSTFNLLIANCDISAIVYFDKLGNVKWRRSFFSEELSYSRFYSVIFDQDDNVIAAGRSRAANDVLSLEHYFVQKFDQEGNILASQRIFEQTEGGGSDNPLPLIELANGHILVADATKMTIFDEELNIVASLDGLIKPEQAEILTDTTFALNDNGTILVYHNDGELLADPGNLPTVDLLFRDADRLLFTSGSNIYSFSAENYNHTFVVDGLSHSVERYFLLDEEPVLYGTDLPDISTQATLFSSGSNSLSSYLEWEYPQRTLEFIFPTANLEQFLLVGFDEWEADGASDAFYQWYSVYIQKSNETDLVIEEDNDVALIDYELSIDENSIIAEDLDGTYFLTIQLNGKAWIANTGTDTLRNFMFFSDPTYTQGCYDLRYYRYFPFIDILPGDTIEHFFQHELYMYSPTAIPSGLELPTCFFVAAPNYKMDNNLNNNMLCKVLVNANEPIVTIPSIVLFPNPAAESIQLESPEIEIKAVVLYDALGRVLRSSKPIDAHMISIPRNGLNSGMYWLQIETEMGQVSRRIVWE